MNQKQLIKIQINNVTFFLDPQYQLVMDLISREFEDQSLIMDKLFGRKDDIVKMLMNEVLQHGCEHDVAMTYFLTMLLQNYGEFERAGKIITQMYHDHPTNLLAQCAYANHFIFHGQLDKIPAIFNNTFDLEKICTERELPLITFVQFMSIVCTYYMGKNDQRNFLKYFAYLMEVAPEHAETRGFLEIFEKTPGRA